MRKSLLLVLLLITSFTTFLSNAQGTWNFAAPTDGSGTVGAESARRICVDSNGNVYMIGPFNGAGAATDFDLSSSSTNTFTASTNDGYIVSYDKNGNFRWKTIVTGTGSDFGAPAGGVCTDGTNVWVSGSANVSGGAATVISSTNTVILTSTGTGVDNFVAKLNCSNGSIQWAKVFGGTGPNDFGQGICIDPAGNSYMLGCYSSTFTLDGVTAPVFSGTISDVYIAKFSPTGTLLAVATGGSTVQDAVNAGGGICYVPGATPTIVAVGHTGAATSSFGSFTGLANAGVYDIVLLELDLNLNYTNVLVFGSSGSDELLAAVYDPSSGDVF
ncbi:MAG: hypothetical protein QG594_382, partial [Bacteroidota bacterium]|nr:hypothetical protein [Bacteroidota bacterium]